MGNAENLSPEGELELSDDDLEAAGGGVNDDSDSYTTAQTLR